MKKIIVVLSMLVMNTALAAEPTACAYDYWLEADMYRVIKESAEDIKNCEGQLLDDMGECVDTEGNLSECRIDV